MADVRIELWDAAGNLLVNQNTLLLKEITAFQITAPGSIDLSAAVPNANNIIAVPDAATPDGYVAYQPRLAINGKVLDWQRAGQRSGLNVRLSVQAF